MSDRKAVRKLKKDALSDVFCSMPAAQRREVATKFNDLLVRTLSDAIASDRLTIKDRADILKSCALARKQLAELTQEALESEIKARELLITVDNGIADLTNVPPSIMDFIPRVSPHLQAPRHLQKFIEVLESTLHKERRIVISCPPQHGKTVSTIHALVWYMLNKPQSRNAYISYQSERAENVSTQTQWIADEAKLMHKGTRRYWKTRRGADLIATGIGGGITGYGFDGLVIVDDPFKGMQEANSPTIRAHVKEWFQSVLMTRVHAGASVIVIQTRWHPEDLAGQLIEEGWEHINLEAVVEEAGGTFKTLWPEKWPLELLNRRRIEVGEYVWSALYMGAPRPKGGQVFQSPHYYEVVPQGEVKHWIGIDMAYTKKTYADYSVAVVLSQVEDKFYVREVIRAQVEPPKFRDLVRNLQYSYPNAVLCVGCATSEQGSAYFMSDLGLELNIQPASVDKFLRAQPVAAAWNAKEILLPHEAWWLQDFRRELTTFTGVGDTHDDQVDALGSAYNAAKYGAANWADIELLMKCQPKAIDWMS